MRFRYYDTDSCIFAYRKGGEGERLKPEIGEVFGTYKNELPPGEFGVKFLSLGTKVFCKICIANLECALNFYLQSPRCTT